MRTLSCLFLFLPILFTAPAAHADDPSFPAAAARFLRAAAGDKSEVDGAIGAFESLVQTDPKQPVYEAYYGAALTLRARDAWMPWNKVKYSEEGLDRIDHALAALKPEHDKLLLRGVPAALETRLVAANTCLKLPDGIFHRRAQGRRLVAELLKNPALPATPEAFRAAVQAAAAEAEKP